jgi:hypothetical protein
VSLHAVVARPTNKAIPTQVFMGRDKLGFKTLAF